MSSGTDGKFPRDKWDMSTGWLRSRSEGILPNFFMFIVFLLSPLFLFHLQEVAGKKETHTHKKKMLGNLGRCPLVDFLNFFCGFRNNVGVIIQGPFQGRNNPLQATFRPF